MARNLLAAAKAQAFLRTNPEASQLAELLRTAASDYASQVQIEKGAARGIESSITAALPHVRKDFDQAQQIANTANLYSAGKIAALSSVADDIKAASLSEHAGHLRRLGETRATTLGEFQSRRVDAKAGAAFAIRSAGDRYHADKAKLEDRILQVQREKGAATTVALQQLLDQQAKQAATRRSQDIQIRGQNLTQRRFNQTQRAKDRKARQTANAKRRKANRKTRGIAIDVLTGRPKGKPSKPSAFSYKAKYNIDNVRSTIRRLRPTHKGPEVTKWIRKNNKVDPLILNAARDLEYRGFISNPNLAALRRAGVRINKYGR